jgi:hypothetical protein
MLWRDGGKKTPPLFFCGCVHFELDMKKPEAMHEYRATSDDFVFAFL